MIYERIRNLREDEDWNQKTMAKKLNVAQTTYSGYETGKRSIPTETLKSIAVIHKTSVDYLINLTDTKDPYPRIKKNLL